MKYIIGLLVAILFWCLMFSLQHIGAHGLGLSNTFQIVSDILFAIAAIIGGAGAGYLYKACTEKEKT